MFTSSKHMKKLLVAVFSVALLSACSDQKKQEKAVLDDIIKTHDQIMGNDEHLMQNKMKLDTLSSDKSTAYTPGQKAAMKILILKLTNADETMEKWMQKFDPEQKEKSHDEVMAYLNDQKKQVSHVDSVVAAAIHDSDDLLGHLKKQ